MMRGRARARRRRPEARRLHQRARHLDPARRRGRDEGDQGRLRRARLRARGLVDEVDDGPHVRRRRRDRGDHVRARAARRRAAADDQLPRARPRRATSTTCRTRRGARQVDVALSNAMGLGGHNGCVLLGRAAMTLTLVRNATSAARDRADGRILVDPMLRAAGTTPPIENTPNPVPNPLVELPFPAEEVVRGIDGCIVTHLHGDHFDDAAAELLPRDLPSDAARERRRAARARLHEGRRHLRRLARPRPRADAGQARHRRDRRGAGAGLRLRRRRALRRGRHDLVRRGARGDRAAPAAHGRRQRRRRALQRGRSDRDDGRRRARGARGDRRARRRRAPRGDEPLPRAARGLPRDRRRARAATTARRSTRDGRRSARRASRARRRRARARRRRAGSAGSGPRTTRIPAAFAERMPLCESSTAAHRAGSTPSRRAASR